MKKKKKKQCVFYMWFPFSFSKHSFVSWINHCTTSTSFFLFLLIQKSQMNQIMAMDMVFARRLYVFNCITCMDGIAIKLLLVSCVQQLLLVLLVVPRLMLHLWSRRTFAGRPPPVEPSDDVWEDKVDVLRGLTGRERMPHARVELERLVLGWCSFVEQLADWGIDHYIFAAMHDQKR